MLGASIHGDGATFRVWAPKCRSVDLVVEGLIPVELKSIAAILQVHRKQLLSQLRLSNLPVGLLINFNVEYLSGGGIKRVVNPKYRPSPAAQLEPTTPNK